ncbi:MAG: FtsQ-type POTRA domain-containing protein [Erysipelotrichaceae bacterium]
MAGLKDFLYDDNEQKLNEIQDRKKRRKRKAKMIRWGLFCLLLLLTTLYFISDYSKVKSLAVLNNHYYSEEDILKKAGLSYNTRHIIVPTFYIEHLLCEDPLIKDVDVNKNLNGSITIKVKEEKVIGYLAKDNKKITLLLGNGKTSDLDIKYLSNIIYLPYLSDFTLDELKNLATSFNMKGNEIDQSIISLISDIKPFEMSYDKHMVKIWMQDGNRIYSDLKSIKLLNTYKKVLEKIETTPLKGLNVCLWADELNASYTASTQNCP